MNNPLKSQIAANRERFDEKIANRLYTLSFTKEMGDFLTTSQTSLLQTAIAAVEGMRLEYESEDFNDGGDDEYRDRRIQIQRRVVSANNQIVSKVVELLKGGIENI